MTTHQKIVPEMIPAIVVESSDESLRSIVAQWAGIAPELCERAAASFNRNARLLILDARSEAPRLPRSPLDTNQSSLRQVWLASDLADGLQVFAQSQHLYSLLSGPDALGPGELAPLLALPGQNLATELFTREPRSTFSAQIRAGEDHNKLIDDFQGRISGIAAFPDFAAFATGALLELVMNATMDAPREAKKSLPKTKVDTPNSNRSDGVVQVDASWDRQALVIRVEDSWGSLSRTEALASLQHAAENGPEQIRSGDEGAGVGLWMVLQNLDQLHFRVDPGRRTVVLGVLRISKRWSEFQREAKVLSFDVVQNHSVGHSVRS